MNKNLKFNSYNDFLNASEEIKQGHPAYSWINSLNYTKAFRQKMFKHMYKLPKKTLDSTFNKIYLEKINTQSEIFDFYVYNEDNNSIYLYIEKNKRYVGSLFLSNELIEDFKKLEIIHSYVVPEFRKLGLGTYMYLYLIDELSKNINYIHEDLSNLSHGAAHILSKIYFNSTTDEILNTNRKNNKLKKTVVKF